MRITRGEAWWLLRRRNERTMPEQAKRLGISEDRLRAWEKDRAIAPMPNAPTSLRAPLTYGEYATICRRRMDAYQGDVARATNRSRIAINRAERDLTESSRMLAMWWLKVKGTPAARTAAPVSIRMTPL